MITENRSLLKYIIFSLLTCGFYSYYFIYKMAQDVNLMCHEDGESTSGLVAFVLLSYLTCGIYAWFWYYKLGNRLQANAPRYGLTFTENGTTVLLWFIVGALLCGLGPLFAMNILIRNTNLLARAYNRGSLGYGNQMGNECQQQYNNQQQYSNQQQYNNQQQYSNQQNYNNMINYSNQGDYCNDDTVVLNQQMMKPQMTNSQQMPQQPLRCFLNSERTRKSVEITHTDFKVGADVENADFVITENRSISRNHAVIYKQGEHFYVSDMNSTNGTYVNERRISEMTELHDGDLIQFADEGFKVYIR